jgi:hypothetical protein
MTAPDQVLLSSVLQNGAVVSVHLTGGTTNGTRFLLGARPSNSQQAEVWNFIAGWRIKQA